MAAPTDFAAELLDVTRRLLDSIDRRDYAAYRALSTEDLTSFEPEAKGQRIDGMPFHEFFVTRPQPAGTTARSEIINFCARALGESAAVVCYTRITQKHDATTGAFRLAHANETRVYSRANPTAPWRQSHFHRSEF